MNIRSTKRFFEENNVVALKADKNVSPEVNELLKELGNSSTAIPYYAVYSPGLKQPIHFGGNFLTGGAVQEVLQQAIDATRQTANSNVKPAEPVFEIDANVSKTKLDRIPFSKNIGEKVVKEVKLPSL